MNHPVTTVEESVLLWTDRTGVILRVNPTWDEFARSNGGYSCLSSSVIGKPLRSFVHGDATKMLLEILMTRVQFYQRVVSKDYRCDSPDERRFMQMTLTPAGERTVQFEHRVIRREPLARRAAFHADDDSPIQRCSMCNRVGLKSHWHEPDRAVADQLIPPLAGVDYTLCERCTDVT